jgi:hypothetical protein
MQLKSIRLVSEIVTRSIQKHDLSNKFIIIIQHVVRVVIKTYVDKFLPEFFLHGLFAGL